MGRITYYAGNANRSKNTIFAKVKSGKIAFGALNCLSTKILAIIMIAYGSYTAITCDINYIALPIAIIGILIYNMGGIE